MGKKSAVSTPLILLQQLSRSLLRHFEDACEQALKETQGVLGKLEKQRRKIEKRLREADLAVETAAVGGKVKAQLRARAAVEALQEALDQVLDRQVQTHTYLLHLQRDVETGLSLAEGIAQVGEDAGRELDTVMGTRPAASRALARRTSDAAAFAGSAATPAPSEDPARKPSRRKPAAAGSATKPAG